MKIRFFVINHAGSVHKYCISNRLSGDKYLVDNEISETLTKNATQLFFQLNPYQMFIFLNELKCCPSYHNSVARYIKSSSDPYVIQLIQPKNEFLDRTWGEIIRHLVWEQLEIDYMFSWLSTLGGAFSALGDYFEHSAEIAGKISFHQMKLAFRLGDPGLISRCKLFLSISLTQQHRFKAAKIIIREQYDYAKSIDDTRLIRMCLGIWAKLQYTHQITRSIPRRNG